MNYEIQQYRKDASSGNHIGRQQVAVWHWMVLNSSYGLQSHRHEQVNRDLNVEIELNRWLDVSVLQHVNLASGKYIYVPFGHFYKPRTPLIFPTTDNRIASSYIICKWIVVHCWVTIHCQRVFHLPHSFSGKSHQLLLMIACFGRSFVSNRHSW